MNNKFQKLFITVWNTPNRYKYFLFGGVFQLAFILFLFIPVIGWIISALIFVYMCGYYLVSIRHNIDNDDFVRVDWREKNIFFRGIRVLGAFILFLAVLYCVIMLFALFIFLLFFLFALIIGIEDSSGSGLGWLVIAIVGFPVYYLLYPYLLLTFFSTLANYIIEDRCVAALAYKKIFKIFKKNWKISLKTLGVSLLITPLALIPLIGFYFAMVLVKITSNYITVVNKDKYIKEIIESEGKR